VIQEGKKEKTKKTKKTKKETKKKYSERKRTNVAITINQYRSPPSTHCERSFISWNKSRAESISPVSGKISNCVTNQVAAIQPFPPIAMCLPYEEGSTQVSLDE